MNELDKKGMDLSLRIFLRILFLIGFFTISIIIYYLSALIDLNIVSMYRNIIIIFLITILISVNVLKYDLSFEKDLSVFSIIVGIITGISVYLSGTSSIHVVFFYVAASMLATIYTNIIL